MRFPVLSKEFIVIPGSNDFFVAIGNERCFEGRIGKLFEIDRREVHRNARSQALIAKTLENLKNRNIALCDGLGKPIRTMRPFAVMENVGQMSVKDECKRAEH